MVKHVHACTLSFQKYSFENTVLRHECLFMFCFSVPVECPNGHPYFIGDVSVVVLLPNCILWFNYTT